MWILMLEAGVALFLLVFIVWWTMFAGRKPERPAAPPQAPLPGEQDRDGPPAVWPDLSAGCAAATARTRES
jgi:hypothetical protein